MLERDYVGRHDSDLPGRALSPFLSPRNAPDASIAAFPGKAGPKLPGLVPGIQESACGGARCTMNPGEKHRDDRGARMLAA